MLRPNRARLAPLLLAFLALLGAAGAPHAADPGAYDRWYVLSMQDRRAGWLHDRRELKGERIVSTSDIHLELKRADQKVQVRVQSEFVETPEGKPVSARIVQTLGAQPTTEEYTFRKDGIDVSSTSPGAPARTSTLPLPEGQWLTPAAASRFLSKRLEAGAKEITLRAIDPSTGVEPVRYTNTVLERTQVQALGRTVPAVKWSVATDRHPDVTTIEYVDEDGVPIRSETALGGLKLDIILADKELALSKVDAPELLVSTLVKPDKPIQRPREVGHAQFVLSLGEGKMPPLPSGGAQSVAVRSEKSVTVTVDAGSVRPAGKDDQPMDAQKQPSTMIGSDDPEVQRLAREATADAGTDQDQRAEAMRRFVHRYIQKKDLGVGFATAGEVARTRAGDCTEHAVLLAALLRADGIPSRVVSGLVYVEEFEGQRAVFGYHMWTQAYLPRGWTDLDAVMPAVGGGGGVSFDATHIALATSNLADNETTNTMLALVPLLGKLKIEVREVEY